MLPYIHFCVFIVIEITVIYYRDNFALMIKFDFTSHFVIVLCLMVILVSTSVITRWPYDMRPLALAEKYMCVIVIR